MEQRKTFSVISLHRFNQLWMKSFSWKRFYLGLLILIVVFLTLTPWGRVFSKTALLLPEVVPNFPIRTLRFLSASPRIEEVEVQIPDKKTKADLYRPGDNKKHPAVVFTLGTIVTRKDESVVKFAQALSRIGLVVLVPDLPDFISGFVWTDSVNTLTSSVEFLDRQEYVEKNKIGFAGFCVGASASIIAAEDPKISNKVAFISAISPYYDLISLSEAVMTKQAKDEKGEFVTWEPAKLSIESVQKGFINYVPNDQERKLLKGYFLEGKQITKEKIGNFSNDAKGIYDFLANSDRQKLTEIWRRFPQSGKDLLVELSPSTKIANLKAKLFVLNDKNDTFVPRIEGEELAKSLSKSQIYFVEVDSFEHVNPKTKLTRLAALKQLFRLGRYLYNVLSEVK